MIVAFTNHVWQSTVFGVMTGLLAAGLRKNRAHVRSGLWFVASVKFLVPFSVLISVGGQLASAVNPIAAPTVPALSLAMAHVAQPFSDIFPTARARPETIAWAPVIVIVWACGFAALALMRVQSWRRIQAAVRTSTPAHFPVSYRRCVQVRSSPGLLEPGVVGFWRPILLVPAGIEDHLTAPQLDAVLAHEVCHVRRRDNLTAAIHMIVEAIFWFHPLVWWIGARLVEERERACDEHVLRVFGQPQTYAEGILKVGTLYVESPLACVSGVTGSPLRKRIEDIMLNRVGLRLTFTRKAALVLSAAAALAAPIVVGIMTASLAARQTSARPPASIRAQETALKNALFEMRSAIDRYYADKNRYPERLDSLTRERYVAKIPADPFTNRAGSWQTIPSKRDPKNPSAAAGIFDVKSGSRATAMDGTKYSDW